MRPARPGRRRLPGGDALREPARDGGRASRCCGDCATRRVYEELERRAARLEAGSRAVRARAESRRDADALLRGPGRSRTSREASASRHASVRRATSGTCSTVACTSRRRSTRRCSSRSRTATSEIDRTVEAAGELRGSLTSGRRSLWRREASARARSGRRRCGPAAPVSVSRSSRRCRRALRDRRRDDLRGLPRPLRAPAPVRAGRPRHGAPARRLPVRAGARPALRRRLGRGGRRHGRADLALRPAPSGGLGGRRAGLGRERRSARPGRAQGDRGRRRASRARARGGRRRSGRARRSRPTPARVG